MKKANDALQIELSAYYRKEMKTRGRILLIGILFFSLIYGAIYFSSEKTVKELGTDTNLVMEEPNGVESSTTNREVLQNNTMQNILHVTTPIVLVLGSLLALYSIFLLFKARKKKQEFFIKQYHYLEKVFIPRRYASDRLLVLQDSEGIVSKKKVHRREYNQIEGQEPVYGYTTNPKALEPEGYYQPKAG